MGPDEKEEAGQGIAVEKAVPALPDLGFLMGALVGVFTIWGMGRATDIHGEQLITFYRNSYMVFLGLASFIYYKRIRP